VGIVCSAYVHDADDEAVDDEVVDDEAANDTPVGLLAVLSLPPLLPWLSVAWYLVSSVSSSSILGPRSRAQWYLMVRSAHVGPWD
jgi:hypothetical protein